MSTSMPGVTGIVLAGGRGRRFGGDKARAMLSGRRMIDRVLDVLVPRVDYVRVISNDVLLCEDIGQVVVPDLYPGAGPLGGLATALNITQTDWSFVLACDLPLVEPEVLDLLRERMCLTASDAIVPRVWGLAQPLLAGYSLRCRLAIERLIQQGQLKMVDFFPEVRVDCVPVEDVLAAGGSYWSFFNINTRDDFALAERYLRGELSGQPPAPSKRAGE